LVICSCLNFLTIVTEFIGVSLSLGLFRRVEVHRGADRGDRAGGETASGSFRFWERSMFVFVFANLLVVPLFFMAHPRIGRCRAALRHSGHPGRRELYVDPADHRHGRHDRRPVAAVLSAVQHHRQADHPAVDQLRTPRHLDRRDRRRDRRRRAGSRSRRSPSGTRTISGIFTDAGGTATGLDQVLGSIPARSSRSWLLKRIAELAPARLRCRRAMRSVTCSGPRARCIAASPTPSCSTASSPR